MPTYPKKRTFRVLTEPKDVDIEADSVIRASDMVPEYGMFVAVTFQLRGKEVAHFPHGGWTGYYEVPKESANENSADRIDAARRLLATMTAREIEAVMPPRAGVQGDPGYRG